MHTEPVEANANQNPEPHRVRRRFMGVLLGGGLLASAASFLYPLLRYLIPPAATDLGSDVPFFLRGGTAIASSRGATLLPLPTTSAASVVIAHTRRAGRPGKTARMYTALRPEHYTDGSRTERLVERFRHRECVRDEDVYNVFESVLPEVDPEAAAAMERAAHLGLGQPHLCGSGPAFFLLPREQRHLDVMTALYNIGLHGAVFTLTSQVHDIARERA